MEFEQGLKGWIEFEIWGVGMADKQTIWLWVNMICWEDSVGVKGLTGYSGESDWLYWLEPAFEELQVQHLDQGLQTSRP